MGVIRPSAYPSHGATPMVQTAQKPPTRTAEATEGLPIVLRLSPLIELTEEQFAQFCELNRDLRIERTATGELEIMSPTKGYTGTKNGEAFRQLANWTVRARTGMAFDSSSGFTLPNGAMRSPDASWVSLSRLSTLTPEDEDRFLPLCPDFVLELRSDTDRLSVLQAKMQEYIANGAQLGLLIDPQDKRVYIYRPDSEVQTLQNPETISADPILPGFTLDLREVWDPWYWLSAETQE